MDSLKLLIQEIADLGKKGNLYKIHKHVCLLIAIEILLKRTEISKSIYYDDFFVKRFSEVFEEYASPEDRDRPYTPFFHLRTTSFWKLVPNPGREKEISITQSVGGPGQFRELVHHAEVSKLFLNAIQDKDSLKAIRNAIYLALQGESVVFKQSSGENTENFQRIAERNHHSLHENPYVSYLNSLHSRDAGNENALAEFQACNEFFPTIHVRHPLVDQILEILQDGSSKESIILTGHAGDGKSTIALSVYKKLKGMGENQILATPLKEREDIDLNDGSSLVIVKDFSEWPILKRYELFRELFHQRKGLFLKKKRLLLISNTGTLLDSICGFGEVENMKSRSFWESELLDKMSTEESSLEIVEGGISFRIFNLSLWDNLSLAERILKKMLSPGNWKHCENQPCRKKCPIAANVALLQEKEGLPIKRLFLMYRKIYEYGIRLTLRQLTAHFAYMLTSGLEYDDISSCQERAFGPDPLEFAFFNRIFGDTGHESDVRASNLRAVREIRAHGFGEKPSPAVERYLWTRTNKGKYDLDLSSLKDGFTRLLERGVEASSENNDSPFTQGEARRQVRRMLYFFHDFQKKSGPGSEIRKDGERYLQQFLGSGALLEWLSWQKDAEKQLYGAKKDTLRKKLYHVIQEEFTGVRLPEEGSSKEGPSYLYVTLNRGRHAVRQSAQIVLAEVDFFKDFDLVLKRNQERNQERRDLVLLGKGRFEGIRMILNLPFLDYMFARNSGYLSESLQAVYGERLSRLKNEIVSRCRSGEQKEILLVRLQTNHTFLRQCYAVNKGRLEVWND